MHLRSLKAFGENIDEGFFVSLLTGKLPRPTMVQMEMQVGGQAWAPSLFCTTLSNLIRAQESANRLTSQHSYRSTRDQPSTERSAAGFIARDPPMHTLATSPSFSTQALTTTSPSFFTQALTTHATSGSSRTVSCAFCCGDHFSNVCTKFKTVEDRKKAAGSLCFRCLRRGHFASDCLATKKCFTGVATPLQQFLPETSFEFCTSTPTSNHCRCTDECRRRRDACRRKSSGGYADRPRRSHPHRWSHAPCTHFVRHGLQPVLCD